MAFATITFPPTIFEFFQSGLSLVCVNKKNSTDKKKIVIDFTIF